MRRLYRRHSTGSMLSIHEAAEVGVGQSMYEIVRYVKANDLGTAVLLEETIKRPGQFKKLIRFVNVDLRRRRL